MKNYQKLFVGILVLVFSLAFNGCTSLYTFTYTSAVKAGNIQSLAPVFGDIPEENQATLHIPGAAYGVYTFAGESVGWGWGLTDTFVKIPSGRHTIVFGPYNMHGYDKQRLTATFEAGRVYRLNKGIILVKIIDITPKE